MRLLLALVLTFIVSAAAPLGAGEWPELLKRGSLVIKPDPAYAKGVNWDDYLIDFRRDICLTPEQNLILCDARNHRIHIFSPEGKLLKSFGQKGQGPGDFDSPGDPAVFSANRLLIGEYALHRRISIFDAQGAFVRLVKTRNAVFCPTPTDENVIAYYHYTYPDEIKQKETANPHKKGFNRAHINLYDLKTNKEKEIDFIDVSNSSQIRLDGNFMFSMGEEFKGDAYIHGDGAGNLWVGCSNSTEIKIYNASGALSKTFRLKIPPKAVPPEFIAQCREKQINSLKQDPKYNSNPMLKKMAAKLESISFESFFDPVFPYYSMLLPGPDNGVVVVLNPGAAGEKKEIICQSYNSRGVFQGQFAVQTGDLGVETDPRFIHLAFGKNALWAICAKPGDEEEWILTKTLY